MRSGTSCCERRMPPCARPRLSRTTASPVGVVVVITGADGGAMPYATQLNVWS